jgi:hypothetical protein
MYYNVITMVLTSFFFSKGEEGRSLRSKLRTEQSHNVLTVTMSSRDVWNIELELVRTRFRGSTKFHDQDLKSCTKHQKTMWARFEVDFRFDVGPASNKIARNNASTTYQKPPDAIVPCYTVKWTLLLDFSSRVTSRKPFSGKTRPLQARKGTDGRADRN